MAITGFPAGIATGAETAQYWENLPKEIGLEPK